MANLRRMQQLPLITLVTVIFLMAIGSSQLASSSVQQPSKDTLALLEFKKGILKDPQGLVLDSWDQTALDSNGCPTTWHGIQCKGGLVTSINLDNLNLVGDIKLRSLSQLKMLAKLSLANNSLSGKLTAELSSMSSLQYFDISNNYFYGRIPSALIALQRLMYLNLSSNNLTDIIPKGFQKLRELRQLDLHSNKLIGPIDSGLMLLQSAEYIDFSSNELSGPLPSMWPIVSGLIYSLQYLNLSSNQLNGSLAYNGAIPFTNLKVLDISNNRLSGQLPSFNFVYSLEILRLSNNGFSGPLPDALFMEGSSVLSELDLSHNNLSESSSSKSSPLAWAHRLKIAVDIARGLNYLHYERGLPHGNLKATNILLDGPDLSGRLADYSLDLLMTSAGTAEQILNAGALGYRAPELAAAKKPKPSFKADVYAFGVILMEILTGKSAGDIVSGNTGAVDLTDWVRLLATEGRAVECFDSALLPADGEREPPKGMDDMLAITLKCIRPVSERPSIKNVFEDLTAIVV